jgi:hypothetical protein
MVSMDSPFLSMTTSAGEPINVGDVKVTPLARSLRLMLPHKAGGLIWNRPAAVLVQKPDGEEQILTVPDVTRQTLLGIALSTLVVLVVLSGLVRLIRGAARACCKGKAGAACCT